MKLIIMTKPTFFVEEDKIISALFDEGLDNLHLRKPNTEPMFSERLLSLLPEEALRKITVHEHYYLKDEYGLAGIHLDNADDSIPDGYKGKFSRTCHTPSLLKDMKKKSRYVFLGNIFDSAYDKADITEQELSNLADMGLIDKHVYALGGVTADNISIIHDWGFGGVVICNDIWNKFDIHKDSDYKKLMSHFEKIRRAVD